MSRGRLRPLAPRERVLAGAAYTLATTVENLGSRRWPGGETELPLIRVGYHWLDDTGATVAEGPRSALPLPLEPGASCQVDVRVQAPRQPGRYLLDLDLVEEHVRWFGAVARMEVQVTRNRQIRVIAGYSPFRHVGDDAVVQAHLNDLRARLPAYLPVLLGEVPEALVERFGTDSRPSVHRYLLRGLASVDHSQLTTTARLACRTVALVLGARSLRAGRRPRGLHPAGVEFLEELRQADALLVASAGGLASEYRLAALWPQAATILAASALGLPVAVSGVGVGPFRGPLDRAVANLALASAPFVSVRDEASGRAARRARRRRGVTVDWDAAVALPAPAAGAVTDALARAGVDPQAPFAVVSLLAGRPGDELRALAPALDDLARSGVQLVFVPMVVADQHDDLEAGAELARGLAEPSGLRFLIPLPPDDVIAGVIARAEVALGSRFHLLVFAAMAGLPAVGVHHDAYTRAKMEGVAEHAGGRVSLCRAGDAGGIAAAVSGQRCHGRGPAPPRGSELPAVGYLAGRLPDHPGVKSSPHSTYGRG